MELNVHTNIRSKSKAIYNTVIETMKQRKENITEVVYGSDFFLQYKYFQYNSTNFKRSPYHLWLGVA